MLAKLSDVLADAQKNGYAVGLFNTIDTDALEAAISAAEEMRSPIIIGTAEVLLPYGPLQLIGPAMVNAAKNATVPVVVHYDHGLTKEKCVEALELGFTSIMFDGSAGSEEDNIRLTREMVRIAHEMGASVEGEIGHVGTIGEDDADGADMYTTPEEAVNFVKATGVDALAVAIGTAHGVYKTKPKLDIERLAAIR
ncbi:MAG: class II fructose-bisphosphate aldolase, partial [Oscillospiraceae bacterium]|nr:class II fructose-bisphosphate aldolase [Oscillospiraceae bacterium]